MSPTFAQCISLAVLALCLGPSRSTRAQEVPPPRFELASAMAEGPPMTADQAAERAARSAPSVARADALARASDAAVARARAAMLPRLELGARYAHVDGFPDGQISLGQDPAAIEAARQLAMRVTDPAAQQLWLGTLDAQANSSGATIRVPRDQFAFTARLTWAASDLFFTMLPALEAAESAERAREAQRDVAEAQVRLRAREAFYQLARARGGLAVAEQAGRQAEAQRAQIEAAVSAGVLTETDLRSAEARVASVERAVIAARAGVEITDASLRMLIGEEDGAPHGIAEPVLEATEAPEPLTVYAARAVAERPELEAMRAVLASQRAAGRVNEASGYPRVALFAGADLAAPNRYVIPPNSDLAPSWEVGAMLSWSPNDTLTAVHRGDELRAEQAETEARIDELSRLVRLEVRQAHAEARSADASVTAARVAREAAESAYDARARQLAAGHATSADLLYAEGQLDQARLAELDAAIARRLALARLRSASGG